MARENGTGLHEGARYAVASGRVKGQGAGQLRQLVEGIDRWHVETQVMDYDHIRLAETILDESGYTRMWQEDKTPEAPGRLENLKELVKALESFDNLQGFLEHVSLIMDNDSEDATEKVTIMTLHAAKGLEFPVVFLPGWEDGLFPSQRSMDESGLKGLEEERRLAYVGITRAEDLATISFAGNRRVYGQWQSALPSAIHRRTAAEPYRGADPARPLWRRVRGSGPGLCERNRRTRDQGGCLQLARLETHAGPWQPARHVAAA